MEKFNCSQCRKNYNVKFHFATGICGKCSDTIMSEGF